MLDGEAAEVRAWDALHVAATTARAFEAGEDGLKVLAFRHTESDGGEIQQPDW